MWICQNYPGETVFKQSLKTDLENAWNIINLQWLKVNTGYEIAKVLSKISMKVEAREYVAKAAKVRRSQLLTTSSCVAAYIQSQNLYAHSLGILIRAGLCTEEDIEQFKNLLSYDGSDGECIILWSRIALEYYGVNDIEKFNNIMNNYVSKSLDKYSVLYQKRILYHIAPALYLNSKSLFYTRLKNYDMNFSNICIENVARYIQTKYPYSEYTRLTKSERRIR